MSRGIGRTQAFVLAELRQLRQGEPVGSNPPFRWADSIELAWKMSGRKELVVSPAEIESVRRAFRRLAQSGLVEARHRYEGRRQRQMLMARLPLSVDERVHETERQHLRAIELVALGLDPGRVDHLLAEQS